MPPVGVSGSAVASAPGATAPYRVHIEQFLAKPPAPLPDRMEHAIAQWDGQLTCVTPSGSTGVRLADMHDRALRWSAGLRERGIGRGSRVGLLVPSSVDLVVGLDAVWSAGAAVSVHALPIRSRALGTAVADAVAKCDSVGADLLLVRDDLADLALPSNSVRVVPIGAFEASLSSATHRADVAAADPAVVQFTSGTTGSQRAVELTHANVDVNHKAIVHAAQLRAGEDVGLSWLPLNHDMGLIGFLAVPVAGGVRHHVLVAPEVFAASPSSWMELVARHRATVTGGPSFAYRLAARMLARGPQLDLSSLRVAFDGSEVIDVATADAFVQAGARHGLSADTFLPVYGMAEATLIVTAGRLGDGLVSDSVERTELYAHGKAVPCDGPDARRLAFVGEPALGVDLRVVDRNGATCPARHVGEIEIRGRSVVDRYIVGDDRERWSDDGWFRTGDRGYLAEGGLVVCGRSKDIVILGGRNIDAQEVERAAARVKSVRAGNVIAFSVTEDGPERLVVVAESRDRSRQVATAIAAEVQAGIDARPHDVVLVSPGTLPKTSSGKLRRAACRDAYLGGELLV